MYGTNPGWDTFLVILVIFLLAGLDYLMKHKLPGGKLASGVRFVKHEYMMAGPCTFGGDDLARCQTPVNFIRLLGQKVEQKTGVYPLKVFVGPFDNSHQTYVIARLGVVNKDPTLARRSVDAIEKWYWDPKNQLLQFKKIA